MWNIREIEIFEKYWYQIEISDLICQSWKKANKDKLILIKLNSSYSKSRNTYLKWSNQQVILAFFRNEVGKEFNVKVFANLFQNLMTTSMW